MMPFEATFQHSWFVFVNGKESGPVKTDRLIAYLKTSDPSRVYVWRDGFEDWKIASQVSELALPPAPPLVAVPRELPGAQPSRVKNCKRKWSTIGAIVGLVLSLLNLFSRYEGSTDPASLLGYIGGSVLFVTIIGFVAGAIADLLRGWSKKPLIEKVPSATPNRNNLVTRHWRGELPLWVSYWIVVFAGNIAISLLSVMIAGAFKGESGYNPFHIFAIVGFTWSCAVLIGTWQLVGVWRSANRYTEARVRAGRKAYWGGLARAAVVLAAIGSISTITREGVPQLAETFRMAFQNDPDIPDYSIRIMRDGTEAEITGGFKFGLTDDFAKIIAASRQIKLVHFDSIGGRLGEGEKMFKLIRDRGLSTYVSSKCLSACTLAFAAGRERYLHKDASLGFHRGAFPGLTEGELDSVQRDIFRSAGFDEVFISKALSTPHKDMWRPSAQALVEAKVITMITDGSQFALSGFGATFTKETIAKGLANALPVFEAIRVRFPAQYEDTIEQFSDSLMKGKTEAEMIEAIRADLLPFIRTLLPLADDDVLVDYNKVLLDQYRELNTKNPSYCYLYASGDDPKANFYHQLSKALSERERTIQERAVKTASKRAAVAEEVLEALWTKLRTQMIANGITDADWTLFEATKVPTAKHSRYCEISTIFMREIGRLPQRETAILMREILKGANL